MCRRRSAERHTPLVVYVPVFTFLCGSEDRDSESLKYGWLHNRAVAKAESYRGWVTEFGEVYWVWPGAVE